METPENERAGLGESESGQDVSSLKAENEVLKTENEQLRARVAELEKAQGKKGFKPPFIQGGGRGPTSFF